MRILLIRHGETALNVARVLQPADTPLSARGDAQAEALAQRLAAMGVAAIVSSDLPRARRTAAAISAATGAVVETSALLQERNFGDWRGRPYDDFGFDPMTFAAAPPGGESMPAFAQRVAAGFAHIVQCARSAASPPVRRGDLAVVTHGLMLRAMLGTHLRLEPGTTIAPHLGNTGLSIVQAHWPHAVTLLDCTQHLGPATRDDAHALSGG